MRRVFFAGILFLSSAFNTVIGDDRQLIWTGWDMPTPATFATDVADFEKLKLFDGSGIYATRKLENGAVEHASDASTNAHWAWSEFEQAVADFQKAKPVQCTNNFLLITANPGSVDWFDDQGWTEVTDHWRLLARLAQKGGLSGLLFDPEPYRKPWAQFLYSAQASRTNHSFAEMQAKARQRGAGVMQAISEEYPGMTIFAYRLFSDLLRGGGGKPGANLQSDRFGLLPSFINGWCDTMPPTITLIDGNEQAFYYKNVNQFAATFARVKKDSANFVAPENRAKVRRQLLAGHGIYLDSVFPGFPYSADLKGASPTAYLLNLTSAAIDAADGFVWIYGEKGRFWSAKNSAQPPWTNKIPGVEMALRAAKNPDGFAREFITNSQAQKNLLKDTDFGGTWSRWQEAGSNGKTALGASVAKLTQTKYGSVGQNIPVKPGESYVVGAKLKQSGLGTAGLLINWKGNGKWVSQSDIAQLAPTDTPDADGWMQVSGLVTVPSEANELVFLCFAKGQEGDAAAIFKDPVVARASP